MSFDHLFHIPATHAGERLDKFLGTHVADLTRTRIKTLIESNEILLTNTPFPKPADDAEPQESAFIFTGVLDELNFQPCTQPSKKLKAGDLIALNVPEIEEALPTPQEMDLDIVFEDDDVIVINKQAGLVVHPGAGNPNGTLVNGLLHHCKDSLSGIGGVARPGIVHRLDKGTSGLMVVAKNDNAHQFLSNQFSDPELKRTLKRTYFALCWGVPNPPEGKVDGNIGRDPRHRQRMKVLKHSGKPAVTHYYTHEKLGLYASFIECNLETGRTHQIRVHMTSKGANLIGDPLYGRKPRGVDQETKDKVNEFTDEEKRPMLHAGRLTFIHPTSKETLEFEADLPQDFENMYTYLKDET